MDTIQAYDWIAPGADTTVKMETQVQKLGEGEVRKIQSLVFFLVIYD